MPALPLAFLRFFLLSYHSLSSILFFILLSTVSFFLSLIYTISLIPQSNKSYSLLTVFEMFLEMPFYTSIRLLFLSCSGSSGIEHCSLPPIHSWLCSFLFSLSPKCMTVLTAACVARQDTVAAFES